MQSNFAFWRRWLVLVTLGFMTLSISLVLAPGLARQTFSLLIYASPQSVDAFGGAAVAYISLVHAVLGAMMFGWGTAMLFIIVGPLGRMSWDAWLTLSVSLTAWFIPDTTFSLWSGFWQNAAFNCLFMLLFAVPLAATYRVCRDCQDDQPTGVHSSTKLPSGQRR